MADNMTGIDACGGIGGVGIGGVYGGGHQCFSCGNWYFGLSHTCPGGTSWITTTPALTVADVERIVASHAKKTEDRLLAIIEKLTEALARGAK